MTTINDKDFGEISISRSHLAKYVRIKISPEGKLLASLPQRASVKLVKELIDTSRDELLKAVSTQQSSKKVYGNGDSLGKSHRLRVIHDDVTQPKQRVSALVATVTLPEAMNERDTVAQGTIRQALRSVLKKEAASYLPRRVGYLAGLYGFTITSVKFNNAKTRWGSCTTGGNINLNIALMQLPHELIDYVVIHELAHTKHMNHSPAFWQLVSQYCPEYKKRRSELRKHNPYI